MTLGPTVAQSQLLNRGLREIITSIGFSRSEYVNWKNPDKKFTSYRPEEMVRNLQINTSPVNCKIILDNRTLVFWVEWNLGLEFVDSGSFSRIAKSPLQICRVFCGWQSQGIPSQISYTQKSWLRICRLWQFLKSPQTSPSNPLDFLCLSNLGRFYSLIHLNKGAFP